jgi:dipeptidyl aminopeptidase/acylaminoacyl peptidase
MSGIVSRSAALLVAFSGLGSTAPRCLRAQDGFDYSPDAKLVAYALRDTLWLVSASRPAPPRSLGQGGMPHFAPKGDLLAFYTGAAGSRQLWVLDLRTRRRRQVTRVSGGIEVDERARFGGWLFDPLQYGWSPDGTRLAFTSLLPVKHPGGSEVRSPGTAAGDSNRTTAGPLILTNATPPEWTLRGAFRRDVSHEAIGNSTSDVRPQRRARVVKTGHLFITDVRTGATTQLSSDDGGYFNPDWSPDGTRIVAVALEGRSLEGWGPAESRLCVFVLPSGRRSCLAAGTGQKRLPRWSPDGQAIAYVGGEKFAPASVYLLDVASGTRRNATKLLDHPVYEFDWSPDGRGLYVAYQDGIETPIARIDLSTNKYARLESGNVWPFGFGAFAKRLPAWRQWPDGNSLARIRVLDDADSPPRSLGDVRTGVDPTPGIRQEVLRWKTSRGDEIEGLIVRLTRTDPAKAPLLVNAYSQFWNVPPDSSFAQLAQAGFVVFLPNHRAPHMWMNVMKNAAYDGAASGAQGIDVLHDDIMSGIDTLIARGLVDSSRMCLFGQSNGGLSVLYLLMRTQRFKCASVAAPATPDWPSTFFLGGGTGIDTYMHGATPWSDPSLYVALSPVYHVNEIRTPLLLSVGDDDHEALVTILGLYNGLRYLSQPVTLLRYPGQGHVLTGAAQADFARRQLRFFREFLAARE